VKNDEEGRVCGGVAGKRRMVGHLDSASKQESQGVLKGLAARKEKGTSPFRTDRRGWRGGSQLHKFRKPGKKKKRGGELLCSWGDKSERGD